jgi:hypothetical protein
MQIRLVLVDTSWARQPVVGDHAPLFTRRAAGFEGFTFAGFDFVRRMSRFSIFNRWLLS